MEITSEMSLELPPFPPAVRLARPNDIARLSIVAYTGASTTQEHRWIRPYANQYPEDTLNDWQNHLSGCIAKDGWILLVAEDILDPKEISIPCTTMPADKQPSSQAVKLAIKEDKVIVGFALFHLRPKNIWTGRFRVSGASLVLRSDTFPARTDLHLTLGTLHETQQSQRRDVDEDHESSYWKTTKLAEVDHFNDCGMTLESLIVHPLYWRRGHGARLVQSGVRLARLDGAALGVVATRLGVPLYQKLGFVEVDHFRIEGDELNPEGVEGKLMKYVPRYGVADQTGKPRVGAEAQEVEKGSKRLLGLENSIWAK